MGTEEELWYRSHTDFWGIPGSPFPHPYPNLWHCTISPPKKGKQNLVKAQELSILISILTLYHSWISQKDGKVVIPIPSVTLAFQASCLYLAELYREIKAPVNWVKGLHHWLKTVELSCDSVTQVQKSGNGMDRVTHCKKNPLFPQSSIHQVRKTVFSIKRVYTWSLLRGKQYYTLNLDSPDGKKALDGKGLRGSFRESHWGRRWILYISMLFQNVGILCKQAKGRLQTPKTSENQNPFFTAVHSLPVFKQSSPHLSAARLHVPRFIDKCWTGRYSQRIFWPFFLCPCLK